MDYNIHTLKTNTCEPTFGMLLMALTFWCFFFLVTPHNLLWEGEQNSLMLLPQ